MKKPTNTRKKGREWMGYALFRTRDELLLKLFATSTEAHLFLIEMRQDLSLEGLEFIPVSITGIKKK